MRDVFYIGGLFLVFAFLATRFPSQLPADPPPSVPVPFASFVTFSPAAHAAQLEAARTSWQVRNRARGRPSIGRLDADIPLLSDALPPPTIGGFPRQSALSGDFPEPDAATYAFLPPTMGAALPDFAIPANPAATPHLPEGRTDRPPTFGLNEMLSIENYRTLKELIR